MKKTRERDKFNSPKLCNYLKPNLHAPSIRKGGGGRAFFLNFEKTVLPSPTHNSEACLHYYPPTLIRQHLGISFLRILWLFLYFYDCRDFGYTYPPPFQKPRNVPDLYKSFFFAGLLSSRVMPCHFNPNQYIDPGLSECRSLWYCFLRYLHKTEA